jgi:hypothetical protein
MVDPKLSSDQLWGVLETLQGEDLMGLLSHPSVSEKHMIKLMERQDLGEQFLKKLAQSQWIKNPRVQFYFVNHPQSPLADAMNFVKFLFWRDLNIVLTNFRIAPEVRHIAESMLIQRLPAMATGEKVTLARLAAGQVLKMLRLDKDPRVVQGLLENSRITEDDVLFLVNQPRTPAPVLEQVARDPKWSSRKEVRVALLRNGSTPLSLALTFIGSLNLTDLRTLMADPKVPLSIRRMIQTRIGGKR